LLITHFHDDHSGGLSSTLKDLHIAEFLSAKGSPIPKRTGSDLAEAAKVGTMQALVEAGKNVSISSEMRCYILSPSRNVQGAQNRNDQSVAVKIVYGTSSMLLMGDLEESGETELVAKYGEFLKTDYLKVGHHGSTSSTSESFLRVTSPTTALISVGTGNKFAHPSPLILDRLAGAGVEILRTDHLGAVILESNGARWNRVR
jgi:competence protein ComEC